MSLNDEQSTHPVPPNPSAAPVRQEEGELLPEIRDWMNRMQEHFEYADAIRDDLYEDLLELRSRVNASLRDKTEQEKAEQTFAEWAKSEGWVQDECPESWTQGEEIWNAARLAAEKEASERNTHVLQNALEALRPFHRLAEVFDVEPYSKNYPDNCKLNGDFLPQTKADTIAEHNWLTLGDCRRAKAALKALELILSEHAPPRSDGSGSPSAKEPRVPSVWREADDLIICKLPGLEEFRISNEGAELLRDQLNIVVDRLMSESSSPGSGLPKAEEE